MILNLLILLLIIPKPEGKETRTVEFIPLSDSVSVHMTHVRTDSAYFTINGLLILTDSGVVIIDTPWGDDANQAILDGADSLYKAPIYFAFGTHFHEDRIGGFKFLKSKGIPCITTSQTDSLIKDEAYKATLTTPLNANFQIGHTTIQIIYPGSGHTADNVLIYLPHQDILHGGCFLKSKDSRHIGNIADADLEAWPLSLKWVRENYGEVETVIPGHGPIGKGAIERSLQILDDYQNGK